MKNACNYFYVAMALAAGSLFAVGCNQPTDRDVTTSSTTTNVSGASLAAKLDGGCCGKCDGESEVTAKTEGCCGKCASQTGAAGKAEGCCGKCKEEAATSAVKAESGCTGNCNACAEDGSANCKCGDTPAAKPESEDPGSASALSNEYVNSMPEDREIFHFLLRNHGKINRTVTELENGVKTVTESTDAAIAAKIQEHVVSMYKRVEDGRPLRMWDELYREIFKHADKITMEVENTDAGISVTETSDDQYVVKLIQEHAKVVSGFAKRGFEEARLNHEPPSKE